MKQVLVTGAGGFIGRALCQALLRAGDGLRATTSRPDYGEALGRRLDALQDRLAARGQAEARVVPAPAVRRSDWIDACRGIDTIVHLGARVHLDRESSGNHHQLHREANRDVPLALARAAVSTGVRRLVFVSTIRVNGNMTDGRPFRESDPPNPDIPYALAKYEAECGLRRIGEKTGLEIVVVRPPLVYGPEVKGNMLSLLALVARGWPLPLAGVNNRRSLVSRSNLVDALMLCAAHPEAAGADLHRFGRAGHLNPGSDPAFGGRHGPAGAVVRLSLSVAQEDGRPHRPGAPARQTVPGFAGGCRAHSHHPGLAAALFHATGAARYRGMVSPDPEGR